MLVCGARRATKRSRVRKNIAYLVINISPWFFYWTEKSPLLREQGRGEV
jgi:hypothetical protein